MSKIVKELKVIGANGQHIRTLIEFRGVQYMIDSCHTTVSMYFPYETAAFKCYRNGEDVDWDSNVGYNQYETEEEMKKGHFEFIEHFEKYYKDYIERSIDEVKLDIELRNKELEDLKKLLKGLED